ncbi:amidohydrolase [Halopenitus sp. H-Gu1]|uniref:amidohydrolase n=1 Tax=Halopenitus sp. H-Gu1 TaxID=3242697 RepID=UPI00359D4870
MTDAADLVLLDGEIHTLTDPDRTHEAIAVQDGEIVRLGSSYDVEFLAGTDTTVVDLDGRVLLPGFIDAHTSLSTVGRRLVGTDPSTASGRSEMRESVTAAIADANANGITGVHDVVRGADAPRIYRDLDVAGELTVRVRLTYRTDLLDALVEAGLPTNAGSEFVRVGAITSATDANFEGRSAESADSSAESTDFSTELADHVAEATARGYQFAAPATDQVAIDAILDVYEDDTSDGTVPVASHVSGGSRHRIEHAGRADEETIDRIAAMNVVASVRPNALEWDGEKEHADPRTDDRREVANPYRAFLDAGVPLAFGSGGTPMDPLVGVHWAVNAPNRSQRLDVTEALRGYTLGSAYAGFDEDRLGTIELGKRADLVALADSPWENPESIREIDADLTIVDGEIVYDRR